jgi:hypothetical protein
MVQEELSLLQQHQLWTFCEISAIFSISPKIPLPQNKESTIM